MDFISLMFLDTGSAENSVKFIAQRITGSLDHFSRGPHAPFFYKIARFERKKIRVLNRAPLYNILVKGSRGLGLEWMYLIGSSFLAMTSVRNIRLNIIAKR